MIRRRPLVGAILALLVALLLQTTLFGRVQVARTSPDLVMLVVILFAMRLRPVPALLLGFTGGLLVDSLGRAAVGLRATVFTVVVYVALRTRDRADVGALVMALWVGVLSLLGVLTLLLVGTLFGQITLTGGEAVRRMILVPLLNVVATLILSPLSSRLIEAGHAERGLL